MLSDALVAPVGSVSESDGDTDVNDSGVSASCMRVLKVLLISAVAFVLVDVCRSLCAYVWHASESEKRRMSMKAEPVAQFYMDACLPGTHMY